MYTETIYDITTRWKMSKYTAEQAERQARHFKKAGILDIAAMLHDYAAILRECESAKAAVTEEMINAAAYALAEYDGADPNQLIWEGNPPEPWGEIWNLYEGNARAALKAVAQMLASARAPEGWQLVPIDPTDEMIEKGTDQHKCVQGDFWYTDPPLSENDCIAIYKAMLAAAPKPETEE